jgi:hypothetical protein
VGVAVTAVLPPIITDLAALLGFFMLLLAFGAAVAKVKWMRRIWTYLFTAPAGRWFRSEVQEANTDLSAAVEDLREQFDEHRTYVGYHLGPNGDTTPIHERLRTLEIAHGKEDR